MPLPVGDGLCAVPRHIINVMILANVGRHRGHPPHWFYEIYPSVGAALTPKYLGPRLQQSKF